MKLAIFVYEESTTANATKQKQESKQLSNENLNNALTELENL